jgi:uroporphyrinogen decarboxylase
MTYRDRLIKTLAHLETDRAPFDLEGTTLTACHPDFMKKLLAYERITAGTKEEAVERLLQRYDIDFRRVGELFDPPSALSDFSQVKNGRFRDAWGIERTYTGMYWDITGYPLKDATQEDLEAFPWPDAAQIDRKTIKAHAEKAKRLYEESDYVVVAEHPVYGYLEIGCWMFGFDDFLYRLLGEPEVAQFFFERYHKYVADVCELYYGALGPYVHLTTSGDDFGTQNAPFLSPKLFSELIAPYYKKRIALTKSICPIKYFHHSCGSVYRLIPAILDMGVDILNPIQPGALEMEPERLKGDYGDKLVFWGGIDEQGLLSNASPDEVRAEVRRVHSIMNKNGGYVLASHNIQPDVPPENVSAMFQALR